MWKRRFIWWVFAALALFMPLEAIWGRSGCDVYSHQAFSPQDTSTCALVRRGFELNARDRPKRAEKLFHSALTQTALQKDRFLEAHAYRGLSDALFLESKYPAAKADAEKALSIFVGLKDARAIALMHDDLGLIAIQDGNRKLAAQLLDRAYSEFEALGDDNGRLHVLLDQLHEVGESDPRVYSWLDRAGSLARELHDHSAQAEVEHARGDYAFADGKYALAMRSYDRALVSLRKSGEPRAKAYVLTSLGRLYREMDDPTRARQCYRAALRLQVGADDLVGEMQTVNSIAVSYDSQKDWTKATRYYRQALVLARRTGSPRVIRFALGNLGGEYVSSGEPSRAIPILRKVAAEENSPYIAAYRYESLSKAYSDLGQNTLALQAVNEAVQLRRFRSDESDLVDSLAQRAIVLSRLGRPEIGLKDTDEALQILEKLRAHLVPNDFLKRGFGNAEQRIYDTAIQLRFQQHDYRSAAEAMEAGRSRAFLDLLATREDARKPKVRRIAANTAPGVRLATLSADSTNYAAPLSAHDMAGFARNLHSTILSYWTTRDALYIVVVSPSGRFAGVRVKVGQEQLRRMIALTPGKSGSIGFAAASTGSPSATDVWRRLYDLLIKPVEAYLPPQRGALLTIIPHGSLFRLPFCALRDRQNHYLVDRYATVYVPAAEVLRFTQESEERARRRESQFLLVSYPGSAGIAGRSFSRGATGNGPPSLAWANDEVEAIHSLLRSQRSRVMKNVQASVSAVTAAMQHSTMIHIASHGEFDDHNPLASFLLLAPDRRGSSTAFRQGRLTAAEILRLHIAAKLVVLSACQTSVGKITGDGVLGLTRAFFAAGAASVVATQWAVADKPSDWLMTRFYQNILHGMTEAQALRSAQLSLIADLRKGRITVDTPLGCLRIPEAPRFWAGYVLEGNP